MRKLFTLLFLFSIFFSCYAKAAKSVAEYPYTENFDDTEAGMMPEGWATAGSSTFSVSSAMDYASHAQSGANVIVSGYPQTSNRTDVAFSPMLEMKGGVEYTMTVWVMAKNFAQNGRNPGYKITVGNAQTTEAQTVELAAEEGECDWKEVTVTFTPEADGQYCFGLWCSSVLSTAGDVFFDTFSVTAAETVEEPVQVAALPYSENFDTTEEEYIPAGWEVAGEYTFAVYPTLDWYGTQAQSGLNALVSGYPQTGNRADVAFSPMFEMKAGVKYTMTVWVMTTNGSQNGRNPGYKITAGNAQTAEAQTVELAAEEDLCDWKEVTVTFTPETDGQYCFGLWCNSVLSTAGDVYFDTFSVTEEETVEEPVDPNKELPYSENFDTTAEEQLPAGWTSEGTAPFATYPTSDWYGVQAQSGSNALVSGYPQGSNRADVAFSPMFEMKGGVEYTMTVWVKMMNAAQNGRNPGYKITAGLAQVADAQTTVLEEITNTPVTDWMKIEKDFTPAEDGKYCFAMYACSAEAGDGNIAIDNFSVIEKDDVLPPTALFYVGNTLNSIFNGSPFVFKDQKVKLVNLSTDADSYKWTADNGAVISDDQAAEPEILFPASGTYTITLQATNEGGTTESTQVFRTEVYDLDADTDDAFTTTSESTDKIFQQSVLPAFDENGNVKEADTYEIYYDYAVGVNPYYRSIAERFEMPSDVTLDISSLSILTSMYNLFINDIGEGSINDKEKTYTVVIYPDKDGKPDTEHPLGSKTEKLINTFGDSGYYQPVRQSISFDEPINVSGTFYVAFEFDELDLYDETQERNYRTWIGFDTRKHANKQTTFYVKPEKALPGSDYVVDGNWCRADEFSSELTGYSFSVMPWVKFHQKIADAIGTTTTGNMEIEISADGENYRVSGLSDGESVRVYSVSGVQVFNGKARGGEVVIPASGWSNGIYVINAGNESVKILK